MLALNADDCMTRLENLDLLRGPIENLSFKNIFADDCYTGIRMLSVKAGESEIRTIGIFYAILRSKSGKTPDF